MRKPRKLAKIKNKMNNIKNAFAKLRKLGWVARMNFSCCGSCGCMELEDKYKLKDGDKFVFYHRQGADNLKAWGRVNLIWGSSVENGSELVDVLDEYNLLPVWNGSVDRTVRIHTEVA
tara:strand:+ start:1141 stop:1494 length:354 start_codon:yes stop_codon:yes gene_type:complete